MEIAHYIATVIVDNWVRTRRGAPRHHGRDELPLTLPTPRKGVRKQGKLLTHNQQPCMPSACEASLAGGVEQRRTEQQQMHI